MALILLGMALLIDAGLILYYLTLSMDNIDALWQLPFLLSYPAALFGVVSFLLYVTAIKPRRPLQVWLSLASLASPLLLLYLTQGYILIW